MAANYWASTQRRHWQFTREGLTDIVHQLEAEDKPLVQQYPLPGRRHLSQFFNQQLIKLGKRMVVRQQVLATAQVYVRRFYIRIEIRRTNPYLVLATALYLAAKMEECPQHIRFVVEKARQTWPDFIVSDVSKLGECEFYLISEMNSQLIVHHPYRTLHELQSTLHLTQDDIAQAWSVINDHYMTDLPLLFPPHVIAIAAIFLAVSLKPTQQGPQVGASITTGSGSSLPPAHELLDTTPSTTNSQQKKVQDLVGWLARGEVDIKAVIECTQEVISFYDVWEQYNEKSCKEQIARFVRARGLDK